MIQLYSLMWVLAVFFGILGFLRGWNREVVATAGILLGTFTLFQFDSLIRGTFLLGFPRDQAFILQIAIFIVVIFFSYTTRAFWTARRSGEDLKSEILGGLVGMLNGYLIGGALWYFVDINEYPLSPYIMSPSVASASSERLNSIPLVFMSGGVSGSGDFLIIGVVVLFLIVLMVL